MKLLLITVAALGLATAAVADEARPGAKPMDMSKMTPEQMHKHCAMVMGGKMQGAPMHDHSADKMGHARAMKPPTDAEMKAMHEKCAALMEKSKSPETPAKP